MPECRFPPPWSVEDPDPKLDRQCFIVRDADGHAMITLSCWPCVEATAYRPFARSPAAA
jgi:hypothetical protein